MQQRTDDLPTVLARNRASDWTRLLPPIWMLLGVAAILVMALGYWYFGGRTSNGTRYTAQTIARGGLAVNVRATGTIQPIDQVDISSELSGTVRDVYVDYNDTVKKGQILAELDTETLKAQLASARATLSARQAKVKELAATVVETRAAFRRAASLRQRQFLSEQGLDQARAAYDRAIAALSSGRADIETARADLSAKESSLRKATIRAPIDGIVLDRNVEPGQTVASSLQAPVLFKLAQDLKRMQLEVDIDEADVAQVQPGDVAAFWVEGIPDRTFPARISEVHYASQTVDGVVTYKAILSIDNSQLLLRPGMTATADIRVEDVTAALLVPNAALRFSPPEQTSRSGGSWLQRLLPRMPGRTARQPTRSPGTGKTVWILVNNQPVERTVKTSVSDGTNTVVLGGTLNAGDRVIIDAESGQ